MATKNPSHIQLRRKEMPKSPRIQEQPELTTATLETSHDSKEVQYLKLKQAYMTLIKASIRIQEEEGNGG